jgi:ubiquitin fusion degradation protein 1
MMGWNFLGGAAPPQKFEEQYHCYSAAYADKSHLEQGDKILLPPSAFDILARLQVDYPMLFQLQSEDRGTLTHCGVLEFTAEEGSCVIPFWMMQNLLIEEGSLLTVTNVSLPKANFVKFQAQHVDFLEISNPRAVLEHALRNFSCITKGDVICVPYNSKNYHFEIKEVRPQDAACIIETDCNVDFDAPVGYKEPASVASSGVGSSASGALANLPKQSAFAPAEHRRSACPSPTPSSLSAASGSKREETGGTRIVDGQIVRADENDVTMQTNTEHLAPKTGATGVQPNAAIAVQSPTIDYWALNAGDGARLDGKAPTALKDKSGAEVDLRKIRAEAAAKRAAEQAKSLTLPSVGKTIKGEEVKVENPVNADGGPPVRKNKSRVGGKFSKLKSGGSAFHGGSNRF